MNAVVLNNLVQGFLYDVVNDGGAVMATPVNSPVILPPNAALSAIRLKTTTTWASAGGGSINIIVNGITINTIVLLNGKAANTDISLNLVTTAYISNVAQPVQIQITGQPYTAGRGIFYMIYTTMPE